MGQYDRNCALKNSLPQISMKWLNGRTSGIVNDAHRNSMKKEGTAMSDPRSAESISYAVSRDVEFIVDSKASEHVVRDILLFKEV